MTKIVSLILLIGSITFGLLMIFGTSKLNQQNDEATLKTLSAALSQHEDSRNSIISAPENNITEEFIGKASEKIADEVIAMNPDGLQTIDGEQWLNIPDPEALANNIFQEKIANFDVSQFKSAGPKLSDLKTVADSQLPIKTYAKNLQNILSVNLVSLPEQPSQKDMNSLLASYEKIIPLLYGIEIPEKAVLIHQQGIAVLETHKNILEKLLSADSDPVGAILVINLLPEVYQNAADFTKKINE